MAPQHLQALETANEWRIAGVVFRRELKLMPRDEAAHTAARIIEHGANGALSTQYVDQLLRAVPGIGPDRLAILLDAADVHSRPRVRELGEPQRRALAQALRRPLPSGRSRRTADPITPTPHQLPSAPLREWVDRSYDSLETASRQLRLPHRTAVSTERSLRRLREVEMVNTRTVEDLLTNAPISMHDLYSPDDYPGLYD